ncbi:hypothetical protein J4422_02270 [Candidatus Pacearchaeota archaeon]|nr:hypothetical protein [Candidatus Pacearchaeota archaeon]
MAERYFVKEKVEEGYAVLYEGDDRELAKGITENLPEAVMSVYNYDINVHGVLISHTKYVGGEFRGVTMRGTTLRNPLETLIQNNAVGLPGPDHKSMSELLAEFTSREVEFLDSLAPKEEAA